MNSRYLDVFKRFAIPCLLGSALGSLLTWMVVHDMGSVWRLVGSALVLPVIYCLVLLYLDYKSVLAQASEHPDNLAAIRGQAIHFDGCPAFIADLAIWHYRKKNC